MPSAPKDAHTSNSAEAILASLDLELPFQRPPFGYLLSLVVVLFAWAVLVLLYLTLVAFFASVSVFGAFWVRQASGLWELGFAVGSIILGATVALFLLKPLFVGRSGDQKRWALHEADEPLLFAYVARLARLVGARPPDRIIVDTRVNASAGHLNLLSLHRGRLELTLGLPLVRNLSLRELTGVLAHEFGHFRQGFGARLGMIARVLNGWFYRSALERDSWDDRLTDILDDDSTPSLIRLPFALAALCVGACRWVLFVELRIGVSLSSFMNRQMEYDADRWEALLSGGTVFAETALKLRILEVSSWRAHDDLEVAYREGRLADDLPGLIAAHAAVTPRETVSRIRSSMLSRRTGPGDSHPSDLDRIERVRAVGPGLFRNDAAASVLFSNLPRICRSASLHYYRQELGLDVTSKNLIPTDRLAARAAAQGQGGDPRARYLQGVTGATRPFFLEYGSVPQVPQDARHHLKRLHDLFLDLAPRGRAACQELDRAHDLRMRATAASRLAAAGFPFRPSDFNLPSANEQGLAEARARADALEESALSSLGEVEKVLRQRLLLALSLIRDPELSVAGGMESLQKASVLVAALAVLQRVRGEIQELDVDLTALEPVLAVLRTADPHSESLTEGALQLLGDVDRVLLDLRRKLGQDRYPWGHVDGEMTMARYLVPEVPPAGEWYRLRQMGHEVRRRYFETYSRLMVELVLLAESVEDAAGLPRHPA